MQPDVSIIIPIHNGEAWINKCFESILSQTAFGVLQCEICVCDDASTDGTSQLLQQWHSVFKRKDVIMRIYENTSKVSGGVGYSKNRAISISKGQYLCFQDIDDIMLPNRILHQYQRAVQEDKNTILGCKFIRDPEHSTVRYTKWANNLTDEQLSLQIYTANGPTIIMPTWFCHRSIFNRVEGFSEIRKGTPEDLIFFYKHIDLGGKICRVEECLVIYYYHPSATTFSIHENTIWNIRLKQLGKDVLSKWDHFTIWNAGKQGRKFYNSLTLQNQGKVLAMCDINTKLIGKTYTPYYPENRSTGRTIPILHFKTAQPPFIICVKMDMNNEDLRLNIESLNIKEGCDFVYFS